MTSRAPRPPVEAPAESPPQDVRAAFATPAIPAGVEDATFLSDPVTDQLVRVVMELGQLYGSSGAGPERSSACWSAAACSRRTRWSSGWMSRTTRRRTARNWTGG